MQVPDFWRSFLTFRIDALKRAPMTVSHKPPTTLNNARLQIEAHCRITERESGLCTRYVRSVSCKTERVGVEQDIWLMPNGDMNMTLSDEDYLDVKAWDVVNKGVTRLYPPSRSTQPDRQLGKIADAFDSTKITLRMAECQELKTADEIIEATLAGELLAGQVEFSTSERYDVILDFPIKVINVSRRDHHYQTDTGPIIFPDFSVDFEQIMETFRWAYVAFNMPDWAEFILQVPTPLTDDISVYHYSRPVRLETVNRIFRIIR